jgi:CHASE3 domain sensor protein
MRILKKVAIGFALFVLALGIIGAVLPAPVEEKARKAAQSQEAAQKEP